MATPLRVEQDWSRLRRQKGIFINPPWDMESIIRWCAKASTTRASVVMLLPNKLTDTRLQQHVDPSLSSTRDQVREALLLVRELGIAAEGCGAGQGPPKRALDEARDAMRSAYKKCYGN